MPRIDAHQHFWRYSPQTHGWIEDHMAVLKRDFLPPDLEPLLRAKGYDGCVAVQAQQTVDETSWLLDLADQFPFIRGVVGWVDLRAPDVGTVLAGLTGRRKLKGIRHIVQGEPDDRFMLGEAFLRGIAALSAWGSGGLGPPEPIAGGLGPSQGPRSATSSLTYDILVYPRQLPAAVELAARFPQQAFVLDHIAKPEMKAGLREPWATQIRKLATSPNVLCKLSGLVTEADWARWKPDDIVPYLDIVTDAFGPTRLMIGSDWPVCALAADYGRTMSLVENYLARLSAAEADAVLGGNATRFYRL